MTNEPASPAPDEPAATSVPGETASADTDFSVRQAARVSDSAGGTERREVTRWAMYSWANHGWVTTVGTVLIGPWLLSLAVNAAGSDTSTLFSFGPISLSAGGFPPAMITVASLLQVVCLPMFGAAADAHGQKRRLLVWTCVIGSVITGLLATTGGSTWLYAGLLFLAGTIVFGATDVVYNSFLPFLVPPSRRDAASGKGFAVGYLGAGVLLLVSLVPLKFGESLGISGSQGAQLCFLIAAVWWLGFGLWAIAGIHEHPLVLGTSAAPRADSTSSGSPDSTAPVRPSATGLRELRAALRALVRTPQTARFLLAFLFVADGISAVTGLASTYITHELFDSDTSKSGTFLFTLILVIQFVAIAGSLFWTKVSPSFGTKRTVMVTLVIWCGVVIYAFAALRSTVEALVLGVVIGLVLGGTQSLARALFSQMIPLGKESTYFSLYAIVDKGTSWVAPLIFTLVFEITDSYRFAILSLIAMFVIGIGLLLSTNVERAVAEASAS